MNEPEKPPIPSKTRIFRSPWGFYLQRYTARPARFLAEGHDKSGNNQRHLSRSSGFLPLVSLCHKSHAAKATFHLSVLDFFSNSVANCHYISVLLTKENEVVAPLPSGLILSCDWWWKVSPQQKGMFGAVIAHRVPSLGTNFYSHATAGLALDKLTTANLSLSTAPRQPGWEQREKTPLLLGSTKEMQHQVSQYMEPIYNYERGAKIRPVNNKMGTYPTLWSIYDFLIMESSPSPSTLPCYVWAVPQM